MAQLDTPTLAYVAFAGPIAAALALLVALGAMWAARRAGRRSDELGQRYAGLMTGVDGRDLAAALEAHLARLASAESRLGRAEDRLDRVDERLAKALQRLRLTRFRAFEDSGGDQSFALALLDEAGDGVVLSGLAGRTGTRVYAKPVAGGRSPYALTAEEERVVADAVSGAESP